MRLNYPKTTARKKVITGSVFEVAAPRDADVYFNPTPTMSKLIVILQYTFIETDLRNPIFILFIFLDG